MNLSHCPSCGKTNPFGASFCAACGSRLAQDYADHSSQASRAAPYGQPPGPVGPPAISGTPTKKPLPSWKRLTVLLVLAVGIGLGVAFLFYAQWNHQAEEPERQRQSTLLAESKVKFGLLILTVAASSPAERSGLHAGDIITGYAAAPVRDITSYAAALDAQGPDGKVSLTVWRDDREIKLTAPGGRLGFLSEDWNPVRKQIYGCILGGDRKQAEQIAAVAERDGSLTPAQALIVKIMLIPNRSSAEREKQRSDLLDELLSVYPMSHLGLLAYREFFSLGSYAAAARCFEELLEQDDPEDVNVRLNLASCYVWLFDYDNAERHVHYIVDRPNPPLSSHGYFVARSILGGIASGRGSYREALRMFSQNMDSGDDYTVLMCMLAAAKLGDLEQVRDIRGRIEKLPPTDYGRLEFRVDVVQAYALAGNGRKAEAAALIEKWGSPAGVAEKAAPYWNSIPGASDVAARMQSLPFKS